MSTSSEQRDAIYAEMTKITASVGKGVEAVLLLLDPEEAHVMLHETAEDGHDFTLPEQLLLAQRAIFALAQFIEGLQARLSHFNDA